jgi:hypothetical protein
MLCGLLLLRLLLDERLGACCEREEFALAGGE